MRIKNLNESAFSLLEILMASIIFIVSVAGIFVTLSAVRGPVANKQNALAAAVFGKQALEALYSQVSDDQATSPYYGTSCSSSPCANFDLEVGVHQVSSATLLNSGLSWPAALTSPVNCNNNVLTYTVSCADGSGDSDPTCGNNPSIGHRVDLGIQWWNVVTESCTT